MQASPSDLVTCNIYALRNTSFSRLGPSHSVVLSCFKPKQALFASKGYKGTMTFEQHFHHLRKFKFKNRTTTDHITSKQRINLNGDFPLTKLRWESSSSNHTRLLQSDEKLTCHQFVAACDNVAQKTGNRKRPFLSLHHQIQAEVKVMGKIYACMMKSDINCPYNIYAPLVKLQLEV